MRLTVFTDYNLRVLMYLATSPERRATISEICAAFDINENHLTKVVHHLGKCGWIETTRGKGGGALLARPARKISVGQVVRGAEGEAMPAECFAAEESSCAIVSCCHMKGVLGEAVKAFYAVLDRYTLADITRNPQELTSILQFHRPVAPALKS